jgi:hypothetical protein
MVIEELAKKAAMQLSAGGVSFAKGVDVRRPRSAAKRATLARRGLYDFSYSEQ